MKAPLGRFPAAVGMRINTCAWIVVNELRLSKEREEPVATIGCGPFNLQITTAGSIYKAPDEVSDETLPAIRSLGS
jgi:hypothetical protein